MHVQRLQSLRPSGGDSHEPPFPCEVRLLGFVKLDELEMIRLNCDGSILVNLTNGNADLIDNTVANAFLLGSFDHVAYPVLRQLEERRYIFPTEMKRAEFLAAFDRRLEEESKRETPNFIVVPTYSCNLDCYYCFERASVSVGAFDHEGNTLNVSEFFQFVDETLGSYESKYGEISKSEVTVTVTGGEPLQAKCAGTIESLFGGCKKRGIGVDIVTNGLNIPDYFGLLQQYSSTIVGIQITLDGDRDVHDSIRVSSKGEPTFDRIVRSICMLDDAGFSVNVRINATRLNIHSIDALSPLIENHQNVLFYVYLMQQEGCCKNVNIVPELDGLRFLDEMKKMKPALNGLLVDYHGRHLIDAVFGDRTFHPKIKVCAAMGNQFIYDACGSIYKCWWAMGSPDRSVGVCHGGKTAWNVGLIRSYRNRNVIQMGKCCSCKYRYVCGGGCTGKLDISDMNAGAVACPDFASIINYKVRYEYERRIAGGVDLC